MNGCWRTEAEIKNNKCNCAKYDVIKGCLAEEDKVSKFTGFPLCHRNPAAVSRKEWETKYKKENSDNRGKVNASKDIG
jgi:hypothetical protein